MVCVCAVYSRGCHVCVCVCVCVLGVESNVVCRFRVVPKRTMLIRGSVGRVKLWIRKTFLHIVSLSIDRNYTTDTNLPLIFSYHSLGAASINRLMFQKYRRVSNKKSFWLAEPNWDWLTVLMTISICNHVSVFQYYTEKLWIIGRCLISYRILSKSISLAGPYLIFHLGHAFPLS